MCVDEGLDGSAPFLSVIIIIIQVSHFFLLLGIGKILIYPVISNEKILFFCVLFC